MPFLRIALLPTLAVIVDDQPVVRFRSARTRALLAFLALESSRAQQRSRVAGILWPDQPETKALHNLSQTLLQLRQALGDAGDTPFLLADHHTIQLNPQACQVDVGVIAAHLAASRGYAVAGDHAGRARELEQAVSLYSGALLEHFSLRGGDLFEEWVLLARAQLHQHMLDALQFLTDYYDEHAEDERVALFARRWLELDPLNEDGHRQFMRAMALLGHRSAAMAQYEACRSALQAELGVMPSPPTAALYEQIYLGVLRRSGNKTVPQSARVAPNRDRLYGRAAESTLLQHWAVEQRSRVVAILGLGGIGKTALANHMVAMVAGEYDLVIWQSLLNAPPLEELLGECIQRLDYHDSLLPLKLHAKMDLLLKLLGQHRCLLVFDNLESVFEPGERVGIYRHGYAEYGHLIWRAATEQHTSCLLLTSREQPLELGRSVRAGAPVQMLQLDGLSTDAGIALLRERDLPDEPNLIRVVNHYSGNPLAIELVASTIRDLYTGDVAAFLRDGMPIFDDVRDVLNQQFARLSPLERELITWLAIEREPIDRDHLHDHLAGREPQWAVLEALRSLQRRSLLEQTQDRFTLQHVVMEYTTDVLVSRIIGEFETGHFDTFARHTLVCAQAREHVRQIQLRLILAPIVSQLEARCGRAGLIARLRMLPSTLRSQPKLVASYAAGNVLNMLVFLGASVADLDLANLAVWQADLRGVRAPMLDLGGANVRGTLFTENVSAVTSVAWNPKTQLIAAGTSGGAICVWQAREGHLVRTYSGHAALVNAVAWNSNGVLLASGAMDGTIRLWDVGDDSCLRIIQAHANGVIALAFKGPTLLASTGYDGVVRIWDIDRGEPWQSFAGHAETTFDIAWSSDGQTLASGGQDGAVHLWNTAIRTFTGKLHGHDDFVLGVAFSHNGKLIASCSSDRTVRLWNAQSGQLLHVFEGHTNVVAAVAFSCDDTLLASAAWDHTVRLWDLGTNRLAAVLEGHGSHVSSLAFSPDAAILASGGYDQTVRLWDVHGRTLLMTKRGHTTWVWSLAFAPDGQSLASSHHDQLIRRWNIPQGSQHSALHGHTGEVVTVAISPDGRLLASAGNDRSVRLWEAATGRTVRVLQGHVAALYGICFSADGRLLVSGDLSGMVYVWDLWDGSQRRFQHGQHHSASPVACATQPDTGAVLLATPADESLIQIWDVQSGNPLRLLQGHSATVTALAWSADSCVLVSGSWDRTLRVWDATTGQIMHILVGHTNYVMAAALDINAGLVASGSLDGTVRVWDIYTGKERLKLRGHTGGVFAVAFSPDGSILASGSDDETIRLWDTSVGVCRATLRAEGPYAGMNIAGAIGLTEARRLALQTLGAVERASNGGELSSLSG